MKIRYILWILLVCGGCMTAAAQQYRIGDLYTAPDGSQGIVYYLHPDGSGGWVVALENANNSQTCTWGEDVDVDTIPNQGASFYSDYFYLLYDTAGYANTQAIRAFQGNNSSYAAGVVDFDHGWVLPSPGQLMILIAQAPFINDALENAMGTRLIAQNYWTSAEYSASEAWFVWGGYGSLGHCSKMEPCKVRPVRSFTYEPTYLWSTGDTTSTITVTPLQATEYTVTVTGAFGCSGSADYTVEPYPVDSLTILQSACEYFVWRGDTLWQSGNYSDTLNNRYGCDSIVTLQLTILHPQHTDLYQTACEPYTWNGTTYSESGAYSKHYPVADGCDSIVTLYLTVSSAPQVTVTSTTDSVCAGENVTLQAVTGNVVTVPPVAVGDILCTDGSTVKPANLAASGKTAMGVVFYVDSTRAHGWAVNLHDQSTKVRWSSDHDDVPGVSNVGSTALPDFSGYANTVSLWAAGDSAAYPAAHTVDLAHGWYLPDIGQMSLLFSNIVGINASLSIVDGTPFPMDVIWYYWSSSEDIPENYPVAWIIKSDGNIYVANKMFDNNSGYNYRVRSIRDF